MKTEIQLRKRLRQVELELDKVRGKEYDEAFGSMRRAKLSRKWDELAKEKFKILSLLDDMFKVSAVM